MDKPEPNKHEIQKRNHRLHRLKNRRNTEHCVPATNVRLKSRSAFPLLSSSRLGYGYHICDVKANIFFEMYRV
ncbi:MAG: hypothetical protein CV080_05245 [Candidatus Kuenenia stuttgartiensis]|nr:MAG: hypothetical protein CV080_05245 [Candidatus Kuenenia stuttgartiensis]